MKITKNNLQDVFKAKQIDIETMELKGYTLITNFFVDSSGFGADDEPALTVAKFKVKLAQLVDKFPNCLHATITSQGQFQVYIGLFAKTGEKKAFKVANNTLKIMTDTGYKIRLHNTDILECKPNCIILNSGGWKTSTTKQRLNKYIPCHLGISVSQKDFEWYVKLADGSSIPFEDGMEIKV